MLSKIFVLAAATALTSWAADASHCYSIKDADSKYECLALAQRAKASCYSIRNADRKYRCLALVTGEKSHCCSIREADKKQECLALTGR